MQTTLKLNTEKVILEEGSTTCIIQSQFVQLDLPNRYQAILDFDLIEKKKCSVKDLFQAVLPRLNDKHFDLFMWSVTDTMIQLMEG